MTTPFVRPDHGVHQFSSHRRLTSPTGSFVRARSGPDRIDAVVVPTVRSTTSLLGALHLATDIGAPLVVLSSHRSAAARVAELAATVPGCSLLAVDVPDGHQHDLVPKRTSAPRFARAGAGRNSDLSHKRNLGLLLARLHGWGKILFLDDDITMSPRTARRIARRLNEHQVAGLSCKSFPDNSVVCHARRLAGFSQDTFVSGSALGVNCSDHPLPFFPDIYNEDWFFFSKPAAGRRLAHAGHATQAEFDPFADPERAEHEEFGDLMAEGLFGLFEQQPAEMTYECRLATAGSDYWQQFISERRSGIDEAEQRLSDRWWLDTDRRVAAIRSLRAARQQLETLGPDLCIDYLDAWQADLREWTRASQRMNDTGDTAEAMDQLSLDRWVAVRFGGGRRALSAAL